jgi:protein SEY1
MIYERASSSSSSSSLFVLRLGRAVDLNTDEASGCRMIFFYFLLYIIEQSSGKSTLLNAVFGTDFVEMDSLRGRSQTTKGVWMSIASDTEREGEGHRGRATVVLDLEGSDGRERGEDDQTFEKQTALFALAASDVLLVNVWCNDIGREQASGKPLLRTILQVNLKLFASSSEGSTDNNNNDELIMKRRSKLVFVIRDRSKTPIELLEKSLGEDVEAVWNSIKKPERFERKSVYELFDVGYFSLPHYEHANDQFVQECKKMRTALMNIPTNTDDGDENSPSSYKVPSTALPTSMREIWKAVRDNKDLDLPAHAIMVATVRCEEIATMCADAVERSDAIGILCDRANRNEEFNKMLGKEIEAVAKIGFDVYDAETIFFEKNVRENKRRELASKLTTVFKPTLEAHFSNVSKKLLSKLRRDIETQFTTSAHFSSIARKAKEEATNKWNEQMEFAAPTENVDGWNFEIVKDLARMFHKNLEETLEHEKTEKSALASRNVERTYSRQISTAILGTVDEFSREICVCVDNNNNNNNDENNNISSSLSQKIEEKKYSLWPAMRIAYRNSEKKWLDTLETDLSSFDLPKEIFDSRKTEAENAVKIASNAACFEAGDKATDFMKQSFNSLFNKTNEGMPRVWTASDDVAKVAKLARLNAINVLSSLAINRIGSDMPRLKAYAINSFQTEEAKQLLQSERQKIAKVNEILTKAFLSVVGEKEEEEEEEQRIVEPPFPSEWPQKCFGTTTDDNNNNNNNDDNPNTIKKESKIILSPSECRQAYRRFESETVHFVAQALAAQQNASKDGFFGGAPLWMVFMLFVLGWNEIMWFLTHPFQMMFFLFCALYVRAILRKINAKDAFKMGIAPGFALLIAKGVPAAVVIFTNLLEQGNTKALTEGLGGGFVADIFNSGGGVGSNFTNDSTNAGADDVATDDDGVNTIHTTTAPTSPFASVRKRR